MRPDIMASAPALRDGELMAEGILVLGAHEACGKTVASAGLAAALNASGAPAVAFKPLSLRGAGRADTPHAAVDVPRRFSGSSGSGASLQAPHALLASPTGVRAGSDQAFLNQACDPALRGRLPEPMTAASRADVSAADWQALLHRSRRLPAPCVFEAVGGLATPWACYRDASGALVMEDALTFARALGLPVVLTVAKSPQALAHLRLAATFLASQPVQVIGWLAVETVLPTVQPDAHWDHDGACLTQMLAMPFLGVIPYHPGISVRAGTLGPVQRLSEEAIDLLPIRRVFKTTVA